MDPPLQPITLEPLISWMKSLLGLVILVYCGLLKSNSWIWSCHILRVSSVEHYRGQNYKWLLSMTWTEQQIQFPRHNSLSKVMVNLINVLLFFGTQTAKQEKQDTIYLTTGTRNACPFCPLIFIFGMQKLNDPIKLYGKIW